MARRKKHAGFAVEHNSTPWSEFGIWNRIALCEHKGEACLIAKLWTDHQSAHGFHQDEQNRVVDLETGMLMSRFTVNDLVDA